MRSSLSTFKRWENHNVLCNSKIARQGLTGENVNDKQCKIIPAQLDVSKHKML